MSRFKTYLFVKIGLYQVLQKLKTKVHLFVGRTKLTKNYMQSSA